MMKKLLLAWVMLAALTGCSHLVAVTPNTGAVASGPKIEADVGLVLSPELKRFAVNESKMGDVWNYANLGQASAEQFRAYLESRFRKVTVLADMAAANATQGLAAVIEPRVESFSFDIPLLKMQVYPASIRYGVSVQAPGGRAVYKGSASGVGDMAGSAGFDFAANPAKSAGRAIEEGVRASVEQMLKEPAVRALLGAPGTGSKDL